MKIVLKNKNPVFRITKQSVREAQVQITEMENLLRSNNNKDNQ